MSEDLELALLATIVVLGEPGVLDWASDTSDAHLVSDRRLGVRQSVPRSQLLDVLVESELLGLLG